MTIKDALKSYTVAKGNTTSNKSTTELLDALTTDAARSDNPLVDFTINLEFGDNPDFLGADVDDLQSGIFVGRDNISGVLKYYENYTGFSGDESLQSGNFLALHAEVPNVTDVTIKAKLTNEVTLDSDGNIILRIVDKDSQILKFTASKEGYADVAKTFKLDRLILKKS